MEIEGLHISWDWRCVPSWYLGCLEHFAVILKAVIMHCSLSGRAVCWIYSTAWIYDNLCIHCSACVYMGYDRFSKQAFKCVFILSHNKENCKTVFLGKNANCLNSPLSPFPLDISRGVSYHLMLSEGNRSPLRVKDRKIWSPSYYSRDFVNIFLFWMSVARKMKNMTTEHLCTNIYAAYFNNSKLEIAQISIYQKSEWVDVLQCTHTREHSQHWKNELLIHRGSKTFAHIWKFHVYRSVFIRLWRLGKS